MTLDDITSQLNDLFDVSSSTASSWAQEAYRRAVADSGWLTSTVAIGTTVAGQKDYALPTTVVQLESLFVNGVEYSRVGEFDLTDVSSSNAFLSTAGGIYAQSSSSAGVDQITLFPTPDASTSGMPITGKAELVPSDLMTGAGAGSSPVFSADLHSVVLDGAIALGYMRADERPDMAGVHEQRFQEGVRKLKARKIARVRGRGPFRARVAGRDFTVS